MIGRGLHGELVALATPSLEDYLINTRAPELLWQYYERNKNHAAAAKILDALATGGQFVEVDNIKNSSNQQFFLFLSNSDITLSQRVEYLARAVVCMRSDQAGYAPRLGVFLRELEDKVEVARIQQQV